MSILKQLATVPGTSTVHTAIHGTVPVTSTDNQVLCPYPFFLQPVVQPRRPSINLTERNQMYQVHATGSIPRVCIKTSAQVPLLKEDIEKLDLFLPQ
jgi:hypothetical protein